MGKGMKRAGDLAKLKICLIEYSNRKLEKLWRAIDSISVHMYTISNISNGANEISNR